ncbi:uncharacterized protein LOC111641625 [Centruroides sculpturatus]|uniref:uncharacterized protein LOC111641625 n=1 Tax=Centruroides sculpturatus TaxID=218467 RepID=UPI000C6D7FE1|nr:uncharacterized protein LOC111641625 [Centruroides sculpturatus]
MTYQLMEKKTDDVSLNSFLERFIYKHLEIQRFFIVLNNQWDVLLPAIYAHFIYVTGFVLYGAIFVDMMPVLKNATIIIAVNLLIGCIAVSRALSILTSIMYDNFISVGRFSSSNLPLEYKFKIIDFMKKFGRRPFGICVNGFFFVKKNFVIRVVSGLYSVLSSVIQLTGVLERKR